MKNTNIEKRTLLISRYIVDNKTTLTKACDWWNKTNKFLSYSLASQDLKKRLPKLDSKLSDEVNEILAMNKASMVNNLVKNKNTKSMIMYGGMEFTNFSELIKYFDNKLLELERENDNLIKLTIDNKRWSELDNDVREGIISELQNYADEMIDAGVIPK